MDNCLFYIFEVGYYSVFDKILEIPADFLNIGSVGELYYNPAVETFPLVNEQSRGLLLFLDSEFIIHCMGSCGTNFTFRINAFHIKKIFD